MTKTVTTNDIGKFIVAYVVATNDAGSAYAVGTNRTSAVPKLTQSITFPQPGDLTMLSQNATLSATASSGLAVSYTSKTTLICSIVSGKLHPLAAGTCTITASQAGNSTYLAATSTDSSAGEIVKASQATLTISTSNAVNISKGGTGITLVTFGGSGTGSTNYQVTGAFCTYSASSKRLNVSNNANPGGAVTCSVIATKAADETYAAIDSITKSFTFK